MLGRIHRRLTTGNITDAFLVINIPVILNPFNQILHDARMLLDDQHIGVIPIKGGLTLFASVFEKSPLSSRGGQCLYTEASVFFIKTAPTPTRFCLHSFHQPFHVMLEFVIYSQLSLRPKVIIISKNDNELVARINRLGDKSV